jgi:DNA-binding NarL/FixJ family response regulator
MERSTRILIVAPAGHSCHSLFALLKTLHHVDLFLSETGAMTLVQPPHLVLIDLGGTRPLGVEALKRAVQEWPAAYKLALVEDIRQIDLAYALGADCALAHHIPAGELLHVVQQFIRIGQAPPQIRPPRPLFATI